MENPLLQVESPIPFDRIRAAHIEPAIELLLDDALRRLEEIVDQTAAPNLENTLLPLDRLTQPLDSAIAVAKHLESVASSPELRAAIDIVEPRVSDFRSAMNANARLWQRMERFAATDEARRLDGPWRRYLDRCVGTLRWCGASLDAAGKARLAAIDAELSALTTKFGQNVLDSTNAFELLISSGEQLMNMPFPAVREARVNAEGKGLQGWRFTLKSSSYWAAMMYLSDGAL